MDSGSALAALLERAVYQVQQTEHQIQQAKELRARLEQDAEAAQAEMQAMRLELQAAQQRHSLAAAATKASQDDLTRLKEAYAELQSHAAAVNQEIKNAQAAEETELLQFIQESADIRTAIKCAVSQSCAASLSEVMEA